MRLTTVIQFVHGGTVMNRKQHIVLFLVVCALVATWLYPPWIYHGLESNFENGGSYPISKWAGYMILFTANAPATMFLTIDWGRLICTDAIVAALGGWLLYMLRSESGAAQATATPRAGPC